MTGRRSDEELREDLDGAPLFSAGLTESDGTASGQPTSGTRTASSIQPKDVDWLTYPYVPCGQITILGGPGGVGKGLACASLVASLTTSSPWLGERLEHPARVLWGECEDPFDTVLVPRLIAANANLSMVELATPEQFEALALRRFIHQMALRAIILSPFISFLRLLKLSDDLNVRAALHELQTAISDTKCALIGICHLNKKGDLAALERVLGSVAFVNFVRSVIMLGRDPDGTGSRLVHAKHNLSPRGPDWLCQPVNENQNLRSQYVRWSGRVLRVTSMWTTSL